MAVDGEYRTLIGRRSISDLIAEPTRRPETETPADEEGDMAKKADPLPRPFPVEPYRAHARFLNRLSVRQTTLTIVPKGYLYKGFPYAGYDGIWFEPPAQPGEGPVLVVRFHGSRIEEVRIEGRNLEIIYDLIALNTMPWIWELPTGFDTEPERAVVITRISVVVL